MVRILFLVLFLTLLEGCGTQQVPLTEARPVPAERIFTKQQDGDSGQIQFVRDKGMMGGGCDMDVRIDREVVAKASTRETFTVHMSPGTHIVDPRFGGGGLCNGGSADRNVRASQIVVTSGDKLIYRIAVDDHGVIAGTPRFD